MGFVRRKSTTGKVTISFVVQKEAELKFMHKIMNHVEKYQFPPSLVKNFDQTLSEHIHVSSNTMEKKEVTNVSISGIDDKISMTATFSITLEGKFLLMQLIYKEKTALGLPKVKFHERFSFSVTESH